MEGVAGPRRAAGSASTGWLPPAPAVEGRTCRSSAEMVQPAAAEAFRIAAAAVEERRAAVAASASPADTRPESWVEAAASGFAAAEEAASVPAEAQSRDRHSAAFPDRRTQAERTFAAEARSSMTAEAAG